jgi:hypothetical protein
MSHWISSSGRAVFEEANILRKQKSVARILANGIMNFWHSVGTSRVSGGMSKPMQIEQSNKLEEKLSGVKDGKQEVSKINMPINSFHSMSECIRASCLYLEASLLSRITE